MFDFEDLLRMSPQERQSLRQALAELDAPDLEARKASSRRRAILLAAVIVCCVVLAAWTGVLAATLPRYYMSGGWRGAWVGFDIGLLLAFAATGWAAWRRRQMLIICLVVLATLLCCDAWFDVILDLGTSGQWLSIASALVVELPIAFLMFAAARRLIRLSAVVAASRSGECEPPPSLWRTALVGDRAAEPR
jgi:peptidoglycan/LPS O-acetylase OafA/YrhL